MREQETQQILVAIKDKYGSLESPDFSFVSEAIAQRRSDAIARRLSAGFAVEEDTDENDDVSFGFLLTKNREQWMLRVSIVGPYAVLLRLADSGAAQVVPPTTPSEPERAILSALSKDGVHLLEQATLQQRVPLRLFNTEPENVRVYQALFTDTDVLPWQNPK